MSRAARRGPWLPEEDSALLHLVQTQGANNWVRISQQLQHRSPKQCRERYHQNLKPSLKHEPISVQEGEIIEQMVAESGKRWAEIARHLGNRSDNAVKNWWNGSMNRRRRNPTQASTGFKQMGTRTQPIPFTTLDRSSYNTRAVSSLHRNGYGPTHAPVLQHHRTHSPPLSLPPPPPPPAVYSPRYATQQDRRSSAGDAYDARLRQRPIQQPPQAAVQQTYSHSVARTRSPDAQQQTSSKPTISQTQATEFSSTDLLPPLRLATAAAIAAAAAAHDAPLTSPAASEMSHSLRRPPSLVSDNLSTCSISPKTVTSPHLHILTGLDVSGPATWYTGPATTTNSSISNAGLGGGGVAHLLANDARTADSDSTHKQHHHHHHAYYTSSSTSTTTGSNGSRAKDSRMQLSSLIG